MDMGTTKTKYHIRTKGIIDHYLQADQYLQIIPTDAQSVEIQPIVKDSHAQTRNIKAKHVINLGTLPANVSTENNTRSTSTEDPKHIKYRLMKYMTVQTVTHQNLAPVKTPSVCK